MFFFNLRRNLKLLFLLSIINLNFLLIKNSFCADIENSGSISSTSSHSGVINNSNNITNLTNQGSVNATGDWGHGIYTSANITNLTNNLGTISTSGRYGNGIYNYQSTITNLTNNLGTISTSGNYGNGIRNGGTITNLANSGRISTSGSYAYGIYNSVGTRTTTLTNSGTVSASGVYGIGIYNGVGAITTTLTNSGTVSTSNSYSNGIYNDGTITNLTNSGTISTSGRYGIGIYNGVGAITTTLTNSGTVSTSNSYSDGIYNDGTITNLNNSQGQGNSSGSLKYTGKLPTYYNIIINSVSNYGKLSVVESTGSNPTFGIYAGSVVTAGTIYEDVLTGVSPSNTSGTYGAYNWTLALDLNNNYDLTIAAAASRSTYDQTVTTSKIKNIASKLETIRTNGNKATLTATLDTLSSTQLESALKKIQGTTTVKVAAQPVQAQSSFKTALSTVTSPGSSSSMTNVTKTNQGNLTFADLQTNNLYAKIQPANYSDDSNFFDYKNNQAPVNALEFFKSNRNINLVEKDDLKDGGFFLRTFGSITNYAAVNSDDNSYGSDTYGLLGGFQHKIDENLYQGYSLGFSKSKLTLDAGEGNTKTNTIHANVYRKMDEKEYGATASVGGYLSFIDNVRNISETSEILKSSPTNGGLDFSLQYVKKMELLGLNFYPSASFTTTYGIVKNYKETGGSGSALEIKSHNVLAIKPEIGFTLENNFVQTDKIVEGANFSLFANRQQYLDGHTNTSSMIGENSWSASTLPKTKDDFLTAGIGYVAKNIDEKSDLNFNFFYTQSTNNSLNSSLFLIFYNKTF